MVVTICGDRWMCTRWSRQWNRHRYCWALESDCRRRQPVKRRFPNSVDSPNRVGRRRLDRLIDTRDGRQRIDVPRSSRMEINLCRPGPGGLMGGRKEDVW